jgi:hypothetical protein
MGSVNAALPAKKKLEEVAERLGITSETKCGFAFYDLDTDKNVLDYFTFLKWIPTDNAFDSTSRFRFSHFLYPVAMVVSIVTTLFAWNGVVSCRGHLYVIACAAFQFSFSIRPICGAFGRFFGYNVDQ